MDAQHFDRLTLQLTSALSRRRFGSVLAALGIATGFGVALEAEAKKKKAKNKKPKKCKKGTIKCGKKCVNPQTNALNCGRCGQRCGENRACVDGQCQTGCPGEQILCGALCVDPRDNDDHCGGCNNPCADPLTCVDGECACAGTICDGECVNTDTDPEHCGGCDQACAPGEECKGADCRAACDPPCPTGRPCVEGRCTCTHYAQCESAKDPHGNFCIFAPGSSFGVCGCRDELIVCATGEACSTCCSTDFCRQVNQSSTIICAGVPANSYWARHCCEPIGAECGYRDDFCCSGRCDLNLGITGQCECAPAGSPCRSSIGCCSGACSISTGKCT
jgi:hypothetical protein